MRRDDERRDHAGILREILDSVENNYVERGSEGSTIRGSLPPGNSDNSISS